MDAAGVLVEDPEGRVLLLMRSDGFWDIPGGMAEPHDSGPLGTAMRELLEETGYNGALEFQSELDTDGTVFYEDAYHGNSFDELGGRYSGPCHPQPLGWKTRYVAFCMRAPKAFTPKLSREHQAFEWVPRDDAWRRDSPERPLHDGIKHVLCAFCCRFG